jgi:hypothetical protein
VHEPAKIGAVAANDIVVAAAISAGLIEACSHTDSQHACVVTCKLWVDRSKSERFASSSFSVRNDEHPPKSHHLS